MKKYFLLVISALVSLSAMADFEQKGFWYYLNGTGAVVTYAHDAQDQPIAGYYKGDVVIPDTIEYYGTKYAVRTIGKKAFYNCPDMTSLTIPATVTTIEGDKTTFEGTPLTSVFGENVTSIKDSLYSGCIALKKTIVTKQPAPSRFMQCALQARLRHWRTSERSHPRPHRRLSATASSSL